MTQNAPASGPAANIPTMEEVVSRHATERLSWMHEIRIANERADKALQHLRAIYAIPNDTPESLYNRIIALTKNNAEAAANLRFLQAEGLCWTDEQIKRHRAIVQDKRSKP